jgi:hypothetical protein
MEGGDLIYPIGSMYGIYANIWGILMVNVTIYSIHGSYGYEFTKRFNILISLQNQYQNMMKSGIFFMVILVPC